MAIFHMHVQNISRSEGRSVVAASAYRAGARLVHADSGAVSDYSRRSGVTHAEILAPDSAPEWMRDRDQLWNAVEATERRRDARLAKEIEFSLPRELDHADQLELARCYARAFVAQGLVVDLAVHDTGSGNPHVHMMLTTRALTAEGFAKKLRHLDDKAFVTQARAGLAAEINGRLAGRGHEIRVDHRSHRARGIRHRPTVHVGPRAREMERKGRHPESRPRQQRTTRGEPRTVRYHEIDRGTRADYNRALMRERAEPQRERSSPAEGSRPLTVYERLREARTEPPRLDERPPSPELERDRDDWRDERER